MSQTNIYDEDEAILSLAKSLMASEDYINSPLFPHFSNFLASYLTINDSQQNKRSILNREMKHILEHIPLGIVIIDAEGLIQPAHSRYMAQLYPHEKDFTFKHIENVLYGDDHGEKEKSTFKNWMKLVFDENYEWDLIKDLGPDVICHESKGAPLFYQNFFHRVTHEDKEIYLIIHIMDVSEKIREKKTQDEEAAAHLFEVELLSSIVDNEYNIEIIDFINDTERLIQDSRMAFKGLEKTEDHLSVFNHLFRLVHSLKGLAGAYGIKQFVRLANQAEDILSLFRDNELSYESGMIDGELASKKLGDTLDSISALFGRAEAIVRKIFNTGKEASAFIRVKRRGIKVDTARLNHVIQQVKNLKSQSEKNPEGLSGSVDQVLSEIISLTLNPLDVVYNRLKQIVRDVSFALKKKAELILEGDQILLGPDSHHLVITALIHILRNSLDHGIELPEARVKSGKPKCGKIHIKTKQSQGTVSIEISDDGRGIDPECVAKKALEKGLISREQLSAMSDREKIDLIFLPGFSTKDEVTDLSGRGVGMDTVQDGIKKLNGTVNLETKKGEGTHLTLTFPMS